MDHIGFSKESFLQHTKDADIDIYSIWSRGYCVDTVGLDSEMIQKYVKHQEQKRTQIRTERSF